MENFITNTHGVPWKCNIIYEVWPELQPNNWILHHDSASAHKVLSGKQFLALKLNY